VPSGTTYLDGVACPSATTCYTVSESDSNAEGTILGTTNSGSTWSTQTLPSGTAELTGIACPSTSACYAVRAGAGSLGRWLILFSSPLSITTPSLPGGSVGQTYSATLGATGGNPPYTWRLAAGSAKLPRGLRLNHATGVVSGTPTKKSETSTFTVEVLDTKTTTRSHTRDVATATFTITIA
jgi:hypothetical protein